MDHEKVFHLHLLGEELLKFRKTIFKQAPNIASTPYHAGAGMNLDSSDILLFKPSESGQKLIDSVTCSTVAMTNVGSSSFSVGQTVLTTDPGFVSDVLASAFTSPVWTGSPLMSSSANQPAVMSEAVFPRQTHRERELERTVCLLQRTVSDQAARIAILEQKLGDPEDLIARQNIGAYVWQISDVARRRSDVTTRGTSAATVHSPCFYTSATGYKLCLRVNLNGVDSGTGRFLAIFVHVNRGTFDSVIDWPFAGVITLRVIDQSDVVGTARQHIVESLEAKPGLAAFQRPLSARNHRGFGFVEFAPLSVLDNARYVRNDTLIIHAIAKEASLSSRT
jgi:TNF receptor-associated factor 6